MSAVEATTSPVLANLRRLTWLVQRLEREGHRVQSVTVDADRRPVVALAPAPANRGLHGVETGVVCDQDGFRRTFERVMSGVVVTWEGRRHGR